MAESDIDSETQQVTDAIDQLIADHDPATTNAIEFRGHRYDRGLAWVHFPSGFGGMGVRSGLQKLVERRFTEAGAPDPHPASFFQFLAAPTIVTHGTDEQKNRFLRPMFTGVEIWCQLFSEPGAGSDFAGLATRAVQDGEEWVVNGQKVWNTLAHLADWGMLVTRTNPELPKHKGMTYFAVDMKATGVEVRPLRQITGEAEFNEVYLTEARVPDANRIGDIGEGWRVSLTTLMNERSTIGGGGGGMLAVGGGAIGQVIEIWNGLADNQRSPAKRNELMSLWVRTEVLRLNNVRAAQAAGAGNPGPEGSISKLIDAELNKDVYSFAVGLLGPAGMVGYDFTFRRPEAAMTSGSAQHNFLRARANSIEGGTSEIMRNILGEQVLGLPGEPRVDKSVAWAEVPRN